MAILRATLTLVSSLVLVGTGVASGPWSSAPVAIEDSPPVVTYVDEPTDGERQIIDWAIGRYVAAGLDLPDLQIAFPATCDGKAGRYFVGRSLLELCKPSKLLALHELAHAWDDHNTIDRDAFLTRRGLDHWYEQGGQNSSVSGGEQLARIMAWGLMDIDTMSRQSEFRGQAVQEQPRFLPGMPNSSPLELREIWVDVLGVDPLVLQP